jgi:hypothetical protein
MTTDLDHIADAYTAMDDGEPPGRSSKSANARGA